MKRGLRCALLFAFASALGCAAGDDDAADTGVDAQDATVDTRVDADAGDVQDTGDDAADTRVDADIPLPDVCPVTVSFRSTAATPTVHVGGEWNDFSETADRLVDDGTGNYRAELSLPPGVHAYKLIVDGDGGERWRLDPDNPYRAYVDGVENSALDVPNCARPVWEVVSAGPVSGRLEATLRLDPRSSGVLPGDVTPSVRLTGAEERELNADEFSYEDGSLNITTAGLGDGKYTIVVDGETVPARDVEERLLPMWIEDAPFDWNDALVYVAMTDRFKNGDPSNDPAATDASTGADFQGGDLEGLTQKLNEGYFDQLGVNAMWITPWMVNPASTFADSSGTKRVTGYHGYWPIDPLGVDTRFGGEDALHAFIEAAHARGIRVLMDLVINHVHEEHPYVRDHPEWFNTGCVCGTDGCDWTARALDCLFTPYMPDINWANREAARQFEDDALEWLKRYDLDGFRVDAVKHVVDGAMSNLRVRVRDTFQTAGTHYFLMGETAMGWDGSSGPTEGGNPNNYGTISRYVGEDALDGQFDFVLYYAASLQFLGDYPGRGMLHVDFWTRASMEQYPRDSIMTPYIGSHDTPRFMSLSATPDRATNQWDNFPPQPDWDEPYDRMYVAFGWLFALPGAPLLYYGDEYGQAGGADPDNRRMMRFGSELSALESRQFDRVSALGRARAALPGLRSRRYQPLEVTEDLWAVARGEGDDVVIAIVNRGAFGISTEVSVPSEVAPSGTRFTDALGTTRATVAGGAIDISIGPRSVMYLRRE